MCLNNKVTVKNVISVIKCQPSWNPRWWINIGIFYWRHWIAGTLKHGYRPKNHVSICLRIKVMAKIVISQILVTAILKMAADGESIPIFLGGHPFFMYRKVQGTQKKLPQRVLGGCTVSPSSPWTICFSKSRNPL